MKIGEARYIGDGVYAAFDGYHVVLMTDSVTNPTNKIYLDTQVRNALRELLESFKEGGDTE